MFSLFYFANDFIYSPKICIFLPLLPYTDVEKKSVFNKKKIRIKCDYKMPLARAHILWNLLWVY